MLFAIDIGNTNTVLGLYRDRQLLHDWRITTDKSRTVDEYAVVIHDLFALAQVKFDQIEDVIISCVVPPVLVTFESLCRRYFKHVPLVVDADTRTGMPICYDHPSEVGADRVVNGVAAYERYRRALIIVDFGTATTFDYICARGNYQGGAIAPGIGIAAEALHQRASKLPRVDIARPTHVIGKNTVSSMQAGIFYGYVGLVDGIVERMKAECGEQPLVIATGGLAPLVAESSTTIDEVSTDLTLEGLRIIHERHRRGFDSTPVQ